MINGERKKLVGKLLVLVLLIMALWELPEMTQDVVVLERS